MEILTQIGTARRGRFETPHGTIETPAFMNVATCGAIKGRGIRARSEGPEMPGAALQHLSSARPAGGRTGAGTPEGFMPLQVGRGRF